MAALEGAVSDPSLLCDLEGSGPVAALEEEFARLCGRRYALAVSSGTAAVHAALLAAGVGPGDEVITTPYSWPQTLSPILFTGATPVFADIDPNTWHLAPESVIARITAKTKAIVVAHLFGRMADMVRLEEIAASTGMVLIADATHALGANLHGRPAGAWGDMACFSLGRGKLVSAGEGGMLVTDDDSLFEKAVALTQHPDRLWRLTGKRGSSGLGLNYRLHPLLAVLAQASIMEMGNRLLHRRRVEAVFWDGVRQQEGNQQEDVLLAQAGQPGGETAAYGIPLTYASEDETAREALCRAAQEQGIPLRCGPVGRPLHLRLDGLEYPKPVPHPSWERGSCPVAESRCQHHEFWALSALDMDGIQAETAWEMGQRLARLAVNIR